LPFKKYHIDTVTVIHDDTLVTRSHHPAAAIPIEDGRLAYGLREAAALVGVGRSSLAEEIRAGRLLSVMRCGRRLVLREDLIDWLLGGRSVAPTGGSQQ
jgi:hypothetical protein